MSRLRSSFGHGRSVVMALFCLNCATVPPAPKPDLPRITENMEAAVRLDIGPNHGSGVVISADGYILTANHIMPDAHQSIVVVGTENGVGFAVAGRLAAVSLEHDLAVVKVDRAFRQPVIFANANDIFPGDAVYNVGYPYAWHQVVQRGTVMRLHCTIARSAGRPQLQNMIAVDTSSNVGSSGSGLFLSKNGRLIGMMRGLVALGSTEIRLHNAKSKTTVDVPYVIRLFSSLTQITAFLDRTAIPYSTEPVGKN